MSIEEDEFTFDNESSNDSDDEQSYKPKVLIKADEEENEELEVDEDVEEEGENENEDEEDEDEVEDEYEDEENEEVINEEEEEKEENFASEVRKKKVTSEENLVVDDEDDDEDEDEDDDYLQKFNEEINKNYIADNHPECVNVNYDEIIAMSKVVRDDKNNIIDDLHRTIPYLTKYERARILGQRAKQINMGMPAFIKVPENVIDGYLVAEMELTQKRIPFIIKRPIPGGGCEYWKVSDLELIAF